MNTKPMIKSKLKELLIELKKFIVCAVLVCKDCIVLDVIIKHSIKLFVCE